MKISLGDYLLYDVAGKNRLCRVVSAGAEGKKSTAVLEGREDEAVFEVSSREVIANFGPNPSVGTYAGVKVEPLRQVREYDVWGEVRIFRPIDDTFKKRLKTALSDFVKTLKQKGYPMPQVVLEIRTPQGKNTGAYKYRPREELDTMVLMPVEEFTSFDYAAAHEYAFGLWHRRLTNKQQMQWIKIYQDAIVVNKAKSSQLEVMLRDLKENGDVSSYFKECDEEGQGLLRAVFRHMKQVHNLDKRHFQMALTLQENVDDWWPNHIELGKKNEIVSTRAAKSVEELFAECFAFLFTEHKVPRQCAELMKSCLSRLK